MTADITARLGVHPSMVLSAYVEPLVRGRRVAVLGDATIGLAERVAERGARLVHAYDPDPVRTSEALSRGGIGARGQVSYAVLGPDLGVRDGAFDVVLIPDLSLFSEGTDGAAEIVRRARRLVTGSGVAVIASPNPEVSRALVAAPSREGREALGYYELFDVVSLQFSVVRMVGQAPFVGYTVADFAPEDEPDVTVDTSLLGASEEPEWYLAVASERAVELDAFAVVEIPFTEALGAAAPGSEPMRAEVETRLALATAELDKLKDRHRDEARDVERRASATTALSSRVVELEGELAARSARVRELDARAGDAHVRAERLAHDLREMEEELARQRDRATRLTKQLDDEKKARTKADVELGMIRAKPELSGAKDRLESAMAELDAARARIAELEHEHANTARSASLHNPILEARIAELERETEQNRGTIAMLSSQRDDAAARVRELELALDETDRARLEVHERLSSFEHRLEERERLAGDADAADVGALEAALKDRARLIVTLEGQLHESERIGRELVEELAAVQGGEVPAPVPDVEPWKERLDALAAKAARCEADLTAASWRVAELERRLADSADPSGRDPVRIHGELEQALIAAREEVALLRQTLNEGVAASSAERGVVEQSVLNHQIAGKLSRQADEPR